MSVLNILVTRVQYRTSTSLLVVSQNREQKQQNKSNSTHSWYTVSMEQKQQNKYNSTHSWYTVSMEQKQYNKYNSNHSYCSISMEQKQYNKYSSTHGWQKFGAETVQQVQQYSQLVAIWNRNNRTSTTELTVGISMEQKQQNKYNSTLSWYKYGTETIERVQQY